LGLSRLAQTGRLAAADLRQNLSADDLSYILILCPIDRQFQLFCAGTAVAQKILTGEFPPWKVGPLHTIGLWEQTFLALID